MPRLVTCFVVGLMTFFVAPALAQNPEPIQVDIAAQPVGDALNEFAEQSGLQVVLYADDAEGINVGGVAGQFDDAATALDSLLASTGLEYSFINDRTVAVTPVQEVAGEGGNSEAGNARPAGARRVLMTRARTSAEQSPTSRRPETDSDKDEQKPPLEEIVVTGTNIRGADTAAPVRILDREYIDRTGFASVPQLIRSLPQNLGKGTTEDTFTNPFTEGGDGDVTGGTGINLRGLGTDSTLVLINGRRTTAGGLSGGVVDVSSIPLSAVERVEILTSGASAIYGADAIAGVVNFVLSDDYAGAETRLRYGTVTEGKSSEYLAAQVLGHNWDTGNVLLSYEYYNRGNLAAADRDFAANSDLTSLGGGNAGFANSVSNPGNIFAGGTSYAIPSGQDGTSLSANDFTPGRLNIANVREGVDLLPKQERHSLFLSASQKLTRNLELFGDFRYNKRESESLGLSRATTLLVTNTNPFFVDPTGTGLTSVNVAYYFVDDLGNSTITGKSETVGGTLGATWDISESRQVDLYGSYSTHDASNRLLAGSEILLNEALGNFDDPATPGLDIDNPATSYNPLTDGFLNVFADGSNSSQAVLDALRPSLPDGNDIRSDLWIVNGKINGELFELPAGPIKFALGGEFRREALKTAFLDPNATTVPETVTDKSRSVYAGFAEVLIPLVDESNRMTGVERLEVSVAGRYEDYSDFGSSVNPKAGLIWSPVEGLNLRGTYGTSFKAPLLTQLDVSDSAFLFIDFSFIGFPPTLLLFGGNSDLEPEESTTWTAGFDLAPTAIPGFNAELTYFNTEFEDRVSSPVSGSIFAAYADPDRYASVLNLMPTLAQIAEIANDPLFEGTAMQAADLSSGATPVGAIFDLRLNNVSKTKVTGFDLSLSQQLKTPIGDFSFDIAGTYLLEFKDALLPTDSPLDLIDTVGNPIDLRLRNSLSWTHDGFGATIFVNYVDGYRDDESTPERSIDSWITTDLQLRYDTGPLAETEWLSDTVFSLSILNLFNEDPPFVNNLSARVGYDPINADPLGRFVSFTLTKRW